MVSGFYFFKFKTEHFEPWTMGSCLLLKPSAVAGFYYTASLGAKRAKGAIPCRMPTDPWKEECGKHYPAWHGQRNSSRSLRLSWQHSRVVNFIRRNKSGLPVRLLLYGWSQFSLLWCLAVVWVEPMLSPVVFAVVVWVEPMFSPVVSGWSKALVELWLFSWSFGQAQVLLISIPSSCWSLWVVAVLCLKAWISKTREPRKLSAVLLLDSQFHICFI